MQCSACAAELPDTDQFCEVCGVRLGSVEDAAPPPPVATGPAACTCGAAEDEIDEDGFCGRCGRRARRPASDHMEAVLSPVCAAVSDRGLKHNRNEDRFGIQQACGGYALVVCDGVSDSRQSELASEAVSREVSESLANALKNGTMADAEVIMRRAIAAGEASLAEHTSRHEGDNPPSTTLVAALVEDNHVTVGWVGDSRAYWISPEGARQLTTDHSWMNEVVASGEMTLEEATKSPKAHIITHWLGADAGENSQSDTVSFPIPAPGLLLLCTDGLWNYAPTLEEMAKTVHACNGDALAVARSLTEFAISKGGQDNITAVVLKWEPGKRT